jgi:hypothetical protein
MVMRRLAATICIALGLVSSLVVICWARSYVSAEAVVVSRPFERYLCIATDGNLIFSHRRIRFSTRTAELKWRAELDGSGTPNNWSVSLLQDAGPVPLLEQSMLGFGVENSTSEMSRRWQVPGALWQRTHVQVPFWFVVLLTGIWPGWALWRRSRRQSNRLAQGLCRRCGFDLAGVYYSCPNCGQRLPLQGFEAVP